MNKQGTMRGGTAIVLAAGRGSRMKSEVPKQYLPLNGRPVLAWSLQVFQDYEGVEEILLVTSKEEIEYCRSEIVKKYGLSKVSSILPGGAERFLSVWEGLKAIRGACGGKLPQRIWVHDGARPLIDRALLARADAAAEKYGACVVGMPVKDTIKISDPDGFAQATPDRRTLWQVQTPQVFRGELLYQAYKDLVEAGIADVTDDAMVVERMTRTRVRLVEGSYRNIKITTPEDLLIADKLSQML